MNSSEVAPGGGAAPSTICSWLSIERTHGITSSVWCAELGLDHTVSRNPLSSPSDNGLFVGQSEARYFL